MSNYYVPDDKEVVAVKMLEKIRAAFAIGNPLLLAGKAETSYKVYMRVVNNMLSDDNRSCFNPLKINSLENTVKLARESSDIEENAQLIRTELEDIYDELIDKYCGLDGVSFDPIHKKIAKCIQICHPLVKSKKFKESTNLYKRVAQDVLLNASSLSEKAVKMLTCAVNYSEMNNNYKDATLNLRESLDYVYNEIRLPEVYRDEENVEDRPSNYHGKHVLIIGFAENEQKTEYDSVIVNDGMIGGCSKAEFIPWKEEGMYGKFKGVLSLQNEGGFALVKFMPKDPLEFKETLKGSIGLLLSARNMGQKTERAKIILSSAKGIKAFNWQCDFILPVQEKNTKIYLPLTHFWPSLFGHALANNGNVDLKEVDSVGISITRLTQSGKANPEFVEGSFCIGLESIHVVKE